MSAISGFKLRCEVEISNFDSPFTQSSTGVVPRIPAGNDLTIEILFRENAAVGDLTDVTSITARIYAATRTGAAYGSVSIGAGDIDLTVDETTWADGTKQHFTIEFSSTETELPSSIDGTEYYLVLYGVANGKYRTFGWTRFFVILDAVPDTSLPVQPGNIVGAGAAYDGSGNYTISDLTAGRALRWTSGANDTSVTNGTQTVTVTNTVFFAQGTSITLVGTPLADVTAVVSVAPFLTADEVAALITANITTIVPPDANFRIANGQLQIWDAVAAAADPTKPWRPFGCNDGQASFGEPVLI